MNDAIREMHSAHVADVNARLAATGRCTQHNPDVNERAAVIVGLANGNEVPLCAACWDWWENSGEAEPLWVRAVAAGVSS